MSYILVIMVLVIVGLYALGKQDGANAFAFFVMWGIILAGGLIWVIGVL